MASGPDLFVICKSCGSEVSPYITECPYCGTRLRKRAPKLERGGVPKAPKSARRVRPRLQPLRPGEIPGIRPDRRPYVTIALVVASDRRLARRALPAPGGGRPAARRPARRRVVARRHHAVPLRQHELRGRHARAPSSCSAGCSSAGTAGGRRCSSSSSAGPPGCCSSPPPTTGSRWAATRRRSRCSPPGRCATCSAAGAAARTTPTCSARWPSPCCSSCMPLATDDANALAGLGGGVVGIVLGLGLARLRER